MTRLMQEHLLRGKLDRAPLAKAKTRVEELPDVPPPDLTDFTVDVPVPPPITEAMMQTAAAELARAHGTAEFREGDSVVQPGDEVLVDLVAYANGRVVPGSAKPQVWLTEDDEPALPGLRAVLNGQVVGKSVWSKVRFGEDAPAPFLVDQQLVYAVDLLAARAVTPAALDDPTLLEAAGVEDVDQLLELVYQGLEAEREQTALHFAQLAVANALQDRVADVDIAASIVDAELAHRWNETEGALLRDKGVSIDDQAHARDAFVTDPARRAEMNHGLRTAMALGALAKAERLKLDPEDLDRWLQQVAVLEKQTVDDIRAALQADTETHEAVGQALLLEKAFIWVLERATIKWVEPDTGAPVDEEERPDLSGSGVGQTPPARSDDLH